MHAFGVFASPLIFCMALTEMFNLHKTWDFFHDRFYLNSSLAVVDVPPLVTTHWSLDFDLGKCDWTGPIIWLLLNHNVQALTKHCPVLNCIQYCKFTCAEMINPLLMCFIKCTKDLVLQIEVLIQSVSISNVFTFIMHMQSVVLIRLFLLRLFLWNYCIIIANKSFKVKKFRSFDWSVLLLKNQKALSYSYFLIDIPTFL